jgi:hypothetical protein
MGLDSIWKCEKEVTFEPDLRLCGGVCSANGVGSFRGKVYAQIIENATDGKHSLYKEEIDNASVREISDALENACYSDLVTEDSHYAVTLEELQDLRRMFRSYAEADATLHGWW